MSAPLSGVRVLDLTVNLPGPYATSQLAELGAEIIKIEPPKGDPARTLPEFFEALNHAKETRTLDLHDAADRAALLDLVETVDVLVEGFRPGVLERLGCGPEIAHARNPRLVYCSISAFGQTSPLREVPAHDLNVQAQVGTCHLDRDASGVPHGIVLPVADFSAASHAVSRICAALYARDRTGQGSRLDVAMSQEIGTWTHLWSLVDLARNADALLPRWMAPFASNPIRQLQRLGIRALPHYGLFRCRDGRYVALGIVTERHFWRQLCESLELETFASWSVPARVAGAAIVRRALASRLRRRTQAEWVERLGHLPVTAVNTVGEARGA